MKKYLILIPFLMGIGACAMTPEEFKRAIPAQQMVCSRNDNGFWIYANEEKIYTALKEKLNSNFSVEEMEYAGQNDTEILYSSGPVTRARKKYSEKAIMEGDYYSSNGRDDPLNYFKAGCELESLSENAIYNADDFSTDFLRIAYYKGKIVRDNNNQIVFVKDLFRYFSPLEDHQQTKERIKKSLMKIEKEEIATAKKNLSDRKKRETAALRKERLEIERREKPARDLLAKNGCASYADTLNLVARQSNNMNVVYSCAEKKHNMDVIVYSRLKGREPKGVGYKFIDGEGNIKGFERSGRFYKCDNDLACKQKLISVDAQAKRSYDNAKQVAEMNKENLRRQMLQMGGGHINDQAAATMGVYLEEYDNEAYHAISFLD